MAKADVLNLSEAPLQTIEDMFAVQTRNGLVVMRVEASVMERYDNDTCSYETFPKGIAIYGYSDEGLLETIIVSDDGRHLTRKKSKEESWEAFGNVVIHNVLKQETMETDTIYWNQAKNEIYTDVLSAGFPAGLRDAFGRPCPQCHTAGAFQRIWLYREGQQRSGHRFR